MNVVHLCRSGWPAIGGLEASVGGLARAQVQAGHDVRVVTLDRDANGAPLVDQELEGVAYRRLRRLGPRRYPLAVGLVEAVRGADVVHAHGLDGLTDLAVATRRRHGAAVGVSTHGGYLHTRRHGVLKAVWLRTLTRFTLARADAVWFTSEADRIRLAPSGAWGPVLPDGVDVSRFQRVQRQPEVGRWLVPGRIDVHKGLDDLLRALAILARLDPRPFHVEITGRERVAGLRASLEGLARSLGLAASVDFVGELDGDALLDALGRAELALLPSRYEGFGIAAVEAMAAGVPAVLADIDALRDHVVDGVTGFVLPFHDAGAAAAGLLRIRDTDLASVASAGARSAEASAWPARAAAFEQAYLQLVGP